MSRGDQKPRGRERGAVLVVGLIFLALLSLLGVAAYSIATQEERMAGNTRDRIRALEAAEAALRDCERALAGPIVPAFSSAGTGGFYTAAPVGARQVWEGFDWAASPSRALAAAPAGVAQAPRCIVEELTAMTARSASLRAGLPLESATVYRVTGRGVGTNPNTTVTLQSYFIR